MAYKHYLQLMRFDKPIGFFLTLWPTLTALWIASNGLPSLKLLVIFIIGVTVMRAAGCVINDIFDRNIDNLVTRTQARPLASKHISVAQGLILFFLLLLIGFGLVVLLNNFLCYILAVVTAALTVLYPLAKRITHLPQVVLGIVFNMGILFAFAATQQHLPFIAWYLLLLALIWTVLYDTYYAMSDRPDDLKIGIKSTAILFGQFDQLFLIILQCVILVMLIILGILLHIMPLFLITIFIVAGFFIYQHYLIKKRQRKLCFQAFLNSHWPLLTVLISIIIAKV